jgi:cytochrome c-type biogenesis protein CcmI
MSIAEFYAIAAGLITLLILIVFIPLHRAKSQKQKDEITNVKLVKARLEEMQREVTEGLLSPEDFELAQQEVKLALVEEQQEAVRSRSAILLPVLVGLGLAVVAGIWVYKDVNHLSGVAALSEAPENLKSLSEKLLDPSKAADISPNDIQALALAIRLRLKEEQDDAQGWMFLGRLRMSLGQLEESVAAFERSLLLRPDSTMTKVSFAQALMMTNSEEGLKRSQNVLKALLDETPNNDNLALMMAVASAQLGQNEIAMPYYRQVRNKLEPNNPMRVTLDEQLGFNSVIEVKGAPQSGLSLRIDIGESVKQNLPVDGYLLVFVRANAEKSGIPIAVNRASIPDFPVTVTLSDDDAMMPSSVLSAYKDVNVTARISSTPDVSAKSGDWQGELYIQDRKNAQTYDLTINKEIE